MPETICDLEEQRAEILGQIAGVGDFRPGSITSITGRCGEANCHCHRPNHPGHGPHVRLTRKVQGKTVTETFSSLAALRKAQREVAELQRFRELCRALIKVNGKICRLRPVQEEGVSIEGKKTAEAIQ